MAKFVTIDVINIDDFALLLKTDLNLYIMFDKICYKKCLLELVHILATKTLLLKSGAKTGGP